MRLPSFALVLLCLLMPVRARTQPNAAVPTASGIHELILPGSERRYTLSIPDGYTGRRPVPFVMALHYGYGGNPTPFYGRGLIERLVGPGLNGLGAIVAAPDNVTKGWANAEGERHVVELYDYVLAHYTIDRDKTLLTGYSMGGMGTWYMAPRLSSRFRAAIAMAGRPQADSTSLEWKTPMYVIHSTADEVVPFAPTQAAVETLRAKGAPVELVVLNGITHHQTAQFAPYLKAAIPWIRRAWESSSRASW